jgi:hypothetical protein
MVREAVDIVADVAERKAALRAGSAEHVWREPFLAGGQPATLATDGGHARKGWELVFREDLNASNRGGGGGVGAVGGALERGECVTLSRVVAGRQRTGTKDTPR